MAQNVSHLWRVEYESGIPVFRQVINQVCAAVAAGRLCRMPLAAPLNPPGGSPAHPKKPI